MTRPPLTSTALAALLALLLFGSFAALSPSERETIRVTPAVVAALSENQEALLGRSLTAEERQQVVDGYVEEEILVREAYRRGLDIGDRRVRPVLIAEGARAIVDREAVDASEPTPDEIAEYYEEHRGTYDTRETIDIESVSFLVGTLAPEREADVLTELRGGRDASLVAGGLGETQGGRGLSRFDISRSVGREFAARVFEVEPGTWAGPFRTSQATYFIRVLDRSPARQRGLDEVDHIVRQEILAERERAAVREALEEVRRRYDVVVEPGAGR